MAISTAVWNSLSLFRKMFVFVRSTAKYFNVERVIESVLLSTNYEEHLDKKTPEKSDSKLVNIRSMGAPYRYLTGLSGLAEFVQVGIEHICCRLFLCLPQGKRILSGKQIVK